VAAPAPVASPQIAGAGGGAVIVCTPKVPYPHSSGHTKGATVNLKVTINCTANVTAIDIQAKLYRGGGLVKSSAIQYFISAPIAAAATASVPFSPGLYQGWGYFAVTFPPGFTPPFEETSGFGMPNRVP
jgi:hypothetical protein